MLTSQADLTANYVSHVQWKYLTSCVWIIPILKPGVLNTRQIENFKPFTYRINSYAEYGKFIILKRKCDLWISFGHIAIKLQFQKVCHFYWRVYEPNLSKICFSQIKFNHNEIRCIWMYISHCMMLDHHHFCCSVLVFHRQNHITLPVNFHLIKVSNKDFFYPSVIAHREICLSFVYFFWAIFLLTPDYYYYS